MISPSVRSALLNRFPEKLVDALVECYSAQRRNLLLGNLRPNEVEGGRFAEAAFRVLEHYVGWTVTPIGSTLSTEGLIKRLADLPAAKAPDSVRLHIPRTLRVVYDIRNKRDAAHLGDGIDPNLQDSTLVAAALDWVLAEFVRLARGVSPDEAYRIVRTITIRRVPAVEDIGGFLKTLRPSLGPSDRTLLLLYHCADNGATEADLERWLKPSQRKNLRRTLSDLEHEKDLVVQAQGRYKVTRRGIQEIERRNLIEVE
jgi:AcrR family transcriptional regulator